MIRYVPLDEDCLTVPGFAWFDTVTETFLQFAGEQAWENWDVFLEAYHLTSSRPAGVRPLKRFKNLYPKEKI